MNIDYLTLANFGDQLQLQYDIDCEGLVDWTEDNFTYVPYNPRKKIARYGLSITSLDGGTTGIPDLDSLTEYNELLGNQNNHTTYVKESDMDVPTLVCEHPEINKLYEDWKEWIFRSHIIKLDPGGFFPIHTDHTNYNLDSFRLIVPLQNCEHPGCTTIMEDKILNWEHGKLYFMNTSKKHMVFNAGDESSYWIILNISCTRESVNKVISYI